MFDQHVRRPFWRRHPLLTVAGGVVAVWLLWHGAQLVVVVTALAWLGLVVRRRIRTNANRDAGLRARAEYEHHLNLSGDPRGIYGRYPPVQPGWFPDLPKPCQLRYFDGVSWTGYTASTSGQ